MCLFRNDVHINCIFTDGLWQFPPLARLQSTRDRTGSVERSIRHQNLLFEYIYVKETKQYSNFVIATKGGGVTHDIERMVEMWSRFEGNIGGTNTGFNKSRMRG